MIIGMFKNKTDNEIEKELLEEQKDYINKLENTLQNQKKQLLAFVGVLYKQFIKVAEDHSITTEAFIKLGATLSAAILLIAKHCFLTTLADIR